MPNFTDFDPGTPGNRTGNFGIINFYYRDTAPSLDLSQANTWINDITDVTDGLVGQAFFTGRASDYRQGPPGGSVTEGPQVINESLVNMFSVTDTDAIAGAEGDVKAVLNPETVGTANGSGWLFNNIQAASAFNDNNPINGV